MKKINLKKIFNKKRVLVTGHTGFKGSWLSLILNYFGATILGVSDSVPTNPSHFKIYKNLKRFESKKVDISNKDKIKKIIFDYKPDFIFHLAAQALVKKSYLNPVKTWRSNTFGTLNILDALKSIADNPQHQNKKVEALKHEISKQQFINRISLAGFLLLAVLFLINS